MYERAFQRHKCFAKWDEIGRFRHWEPILEKRKKLKVAIYVLVDPRDDTVRYVGQTRDPHRRAEQHRKNENRKSNKELWAWKAELKAQGLAPKLEVVDWVKTLRWEEAETYWIHHVASFGRTYNIAIGGTGKRRKKSEAQNYVRNTANREHAALQKKMYGSRRKALQVLSGGFLADTPKLPSADSRRGAEALEAFLAADT